MTELPARTSENIAEIAAIAYARSRAVAESICWDLNECLPCLKTTDLLSAIVDRNIFDEDVGERTEELLRRIEIDVDQGTSR